MYYFQAFGDNGVIGRFNDGTEHSGFSMDLLGSSCFILALVVSG
ncbi:hypothetical protein [Pedobacter frigidisoli]|nr:hypothetical protein [Pedobacter frigidisoli]